MAWLVTDCPQAKHRLAGECLLRPYRYPDPRTREANELHALAIFISFESVLGDDRREARWHFNDPENNHNLGIRRDSTAVVFPLNISDSTTCARKNG